MFQFKSVLVQSPDDIAEALDVVTCIDSGRVFITRLANHLTGNETTQAHIRHACFLVLRIGEGNNPYLNDAVATLW